MATGASDPLTQVYNFHGFRAIFCVSTAAAGRCQLACPSCNRRLVAASSLITSPDKNLPDRHLSSRRFQPQLARPSRQASLRELFIKQNQAFLNKKSRCAQRCFVPTDADACVTCALLEYMTWQVVLCGQRCKQGVFHRCLPSPLFACRIPLHASQPRRPGNLESCFIGPQMWLRWVGTEGRLMDEPSGLGPCGP